MSRLSLQFKVLDPLPVITRRLREAVAGHINDSAKTAAKGIKAKLPQIIRDGILNSYEAQSLRGGDLQAELGVTNSKVHEALEAIIQALSNTTEVIVNPMPVYGGSFKATIDVAIMPKTLVDDIIKHPSGVYQTVQGTNIPWLTWLLTLGDRIIIRRHVVDYGNTRTSRTGLATMRKDGSRSWRVPPQFSGTRTDNFITRALEDVVDDISYMALLETRNAI